MKYTGERVRELRRNMEIPVKTFLAELEINPNVFFKKERGDVKFSLVEAYKISKMFSKPIEDIFFTA